MGRRIMEKGFPMFLGSLSLYEGHYDGVFDKPTAAYLRPKMEHLVSILVAAKFVPVKGVPIPRYEFVPV